MTMWQLNYILDIILDSKYEWDGEELPDRGVIEVTQEEGKILQGVLMMFGHHWLDFDYGPIPFRCRRLRAPHSETYVLQWCHDRILSWYDSTDNLSFVNRWEILYFKDFENERILTLPEKYRGWKMGITYGI
jgi:hypothetical protein